MGLLFSYLDKPVTDKVSSDEKNDKLNCGASSMQGWRQSQEDAHNCILDFDDDASFFAVYDGHGGHEVAQYCSMELPNYLKDTDAYKSGDYGEALVDAFLGFDATLVIQEVNKKLKVIASLDKTETDSEEEDVSNLYEEAAMPIEKVIEKYAANLCNKYVKKEYEKISSEAEPEPGMSGASTSSKVSTMEESAVDAVSSTNGDDNVGEKIVAASEETRSSENGGSGDCAPDTLSSTAEITSSKSEIKKAQQSSTCDGSGDQVNNGEVSSAAEENKDVSSSSNVLENGEIDKKGKGKALVKPSQVNKSTINTRPKNNCMELYRKLLNDEEDSDDESEDEEDKTFNEPNEDSSDDEDSEGVNPALMENSGSSEEDEENEDEDDEEGDEEEDDDDEEGDEEEEDDDNIMEEARHRHKYGPGYESGCTAVVALLKGRELYVANAGDSRCVLCRNGKAVDMSSDHKPWDKIEKNRIYKAGGYVSFDGRVDSGLNLSRAMGDHKYKQNKELSDKEQKITALPDIRTLTINPEQDEFMVLACDGIWNSMTSQDVIDFVRPRVKEGREKLSQICEEMFDHCLAPDTDNDENGCDNMSAIIVQFREHSTKRPLSRSPELCTKRAKTEVVEAQPADTTK